MPTEELYSIDRTPSTSLQKKVEPLDLDVRGIINRVLEEDESTMISNPKNMDDFEFNYARQRGKIKTAIDTARLIREQINTYTRENILAPAKFALPEMGWGNRTKQTRQAPDFKFDTSLDPRSKRYELSIFQEGEGLLTQIRKSVSEYDHREGAVKYINDIVEVYKKSDGWHDLKDTSIIFTLMMFYDNSFNLLMNNINDAYSTLNNLDEDLIPDDITGFYLSAILEKIQSEDTTKIQRTINELEKIVAASDKVQRQATALGGSSTSAELLFQRWLEAGLWGVLGTVNTVLQGNRKTLYAFLLDEFADDQDMFERIFLSDTLSDTTRKMITLKLTDKHLKSYYKAHWSAGDSFEHWRDEGGNPNIIILDCGASDHHPEYFSKKDAWTEYLNTDKKDEKQYNEAIESVSENLDIFTTEEERYLIAVLMKVFFTPHGDPWLISPDREDLGTGEVNEGGSEQGFNYTQTQRGMYDVEFNGKEADNGSGDKGEVVVEIILEPRESVYKDFDEVYISGYTNDSYGVENHINETFGRDEPLNDFVSAACRYLLPLHLNIQELQELSNRASLLIDMLSNLDAVDALAITNVLPGTDFSGILSNGSINIGLALKEYYDICQPSNIPIVQNRYKPINFKERIALNSLFCESELLENLIDEQLKIFSLGISRDAIGTDLAPETIYIEITKKDTLYPDVVFKKYKTKVDVLNFPVINGYTFWSTKLGDLFPQEIQTGGLTSGQTFNSFEEFVENGMHFLNFKNIAKESLETTIQPLTMNEILDRYSSDSAKENVKTRLINAAKSKVLGIYLRSLTGTEFKGIDLDPLESKTWYDEDAEENFSKLYAASGPSEISKRFKDIILNTSTVLNTEKITKDVLKLHDILYTFHVLVDIDKDFPVISGGSYNDNKALENIEFTVNSHFYSNIQDTVEEELEYEYGSETWEIV